MPRPWILLFCLAILSHGCQPKQPLLEDWSVERISPELGPDAAPVLLNQSLTVYFSAPLQPLSVSPASIAVLDAAGHPVPGDLRVGPGWASWVPRVPLTADLRDGSLLPGQRYRLVLAGHPRPDALRSADGRRLARPLLREFRAVDFDAGPLGVLRSPTPGLPCLLRLPEATPAVPADEPRLLLRFTAPLLPASLQPHSLRIRRLGNPMEELQPSAMRLRSLPHDEFPGSTLEVDLAAPLRNRDGAVVRPLRPGDWLSVAVQGTAMPLRDYAGEPVLATGELCLTVIAGREQQSSIALQEGDLLAGEDPLLPGLEVRGGVLRPRLQLEAGDGSLGVFRPQRDTVIRLGQAFDRGDGTAVLAAGSALPFLAVEIPRGVKVELDPAGGLLQLLSCGSMQIDGELVIHAAPVAMPVLRLGQAAADLLEMVPVALLAGGDMNFGGTVVTTLPVTAGQTSLLLAAAGRLQLDSELPFNTILAVAAATATVGQPAISGTRGQTVTTAVAFTPGVPPGALFPLRGWTPWKQLPADQEGGELRLLGAVPGLAVAWQHAPPDPVRANEPDLAVGRVSSWQPAKDRDLLLAGPGHWLRFALELPPEALAQAGPVLQQLRLVDR